MQTFCKKRKKKEIQIRAAKIRLKNSASKLLVCCFDLSSSLSLLSLLLKDKLFKCNWIWAKRVEGISGTFLVRRGPSSKAESSGKAWKRLQVQLLVWILFKQTKSPRSANEILPEVSFAWFMELVLWQKDKFSGRQMCFTIIIYHV